jgi:Pyridoxamine 5'-phosphate oxidase
MDKAFSTPRPQSRTVEFHRDLDESRVSLRTIARDERGRMQKTPGRRKAMTQERAPERERSLVGEESGTTSWEVARDRLANPEEQRTSWLATTRPDGRPHLVPVIAFWIEGAIHIVAGEGTRKARNLAADGRCVIATSSTTLPSLDIVVEGRADPLIEGDAVGHIAEVLNASGWPLEAKGDKVYGPNAPTAGPPPYTIFRIVPSKVFGLPGMYGMDQFDQADLPRPTRWDFGRG